ncbi:MAG: ribosome hibernation-promoting factor, HPF/YfiA family [Planctomycetota bacterium]
MQIDIAAHHMDVTEPIRELIQERAEHLLRFFDGVATIHVTLTAEKERRIAEVVANISHGPPAIGKAVTEDVRTAIHDACEKVETQLRRHKDKIRDHRDRRSPGRPAPPGQAGGEPEGSPQDDERSEGHDSG